MKTLLKAVALVALASSVTSVATAQETYPAPTDPSGGALIVAIWDNVANASLVYAIPNTFYQDLRNGSFTSFNNPIPQFGTVFEASDASNINYSVYAGGLFVDGFPQFVAPNAFFVTGPLGGSPTPNNGQVNDTGTNAATFYGFLRSACGTDAVCTSDNPSEGRFAGGEAWGPTLGGRLSGFGTNTTVGDSLAFFDVSQRGNDPFGTGFPDFPIEADAIVTDTLGVWLLDANGNLSYSVVPLPAAAWLLLSGLFGFGAIARRRSAA